jgi:replicative superfamily II helicase
MNRKIDNYLSENLPDLMDEYKIADSKDIMDLDQDFNGFEKRMLDLEDWRKEFDPRLITGRKKIDLLKIKYGMDGGGKK